VWPGDLSRRYKQRYRDFFVSPRISASPPGKYLRSLGRSPLARTAIGLGARLHHRKNRDAKAVLIGNPAMAAIEAAGPDPAQRSFDARQIFPRCMKDSGLDSSFTFLYRRASDHGAAEAAVAECQGGRLRSCLGGLLPGGTSIVDPFLPFEENSGCPTPTFQQEPRWQKRRPRCALNASRREPPQPKAPAGNGTLLPRDHVPASPTCKSRSRRSVKRPTRYPAHLFLLRDSGGLASFYAERAFGLNGAVTRATSTKFGLLGCAAL